MNWLKNNLSVEQIKLILPHRFSFLLIDRVLSISVPDDGKIEGTNSECVKCLSFTDPVFHGHFPNEAIFPGVMQLESMAQASAMCILPSLVQSSDLLHTMPKLKVFLLSANDVRFRKPVVPGDRLILKSKVLKIKKNIWQFECQTINDGNLVSEAIVLAMMEVNSRDET